MKQLLYWLSILLILAMWPLSFYLSNTQSWQLFAAAVLCITAGVVMEIRKSSYFPIPFLLLPFIHPVYLLFPVLFALFYLKDIKKPILFVYIIVTVTTGLLYFRSFYNYSIFTPDPLAYDTLVKKIALIPNRNLARIFENKTTVYQEKYIQNIFTSLDPNNYFFAMHPQEKGEGQNLSKFTFLSIIPFLIGVFYLPNSKHKKIIISVLISAILSVAFINNQDRYDSIIYIPISMLVILGLSELKKSKWFSVFAAIFVFASVYELTRVLFIKL